MFERIKMFEQKNKKDQNITDSKQINPKKNIIETPIKNKKDFPKSINMDKIKTDNKNDILEIDYMRKNKFLENINNSNENSYTRQSIKRNSFIKKKNNEISLFSNTKKNKKTIGGSMDNKNIIYKNFINNIKKGIKNNNQIENKKIKNYKNKNILGNFLNQFVNKTQNQKQDDLNDKNILIVNSEQKISTHNHSFKNINIIKQISFVIESNQNSNKEIIQLKKKLKSKDNEIKDLIKNMEKYNNIIQENEKLKKEILHYKNIINQMNPIPIEEKNNNNNSNSNLENIRSNKTNLNKENNKFNNLITYNINKNNNYNIITNQINNFDNLNINNQNKKDIDIIKKENIIKNIEEEKKENENERIIINNERAKKATRAFQRFKRANRSIDLSSTGKGNPLKSDNILIIAKMLEGHLGNKDNNKIDREKSVEVSHKIEDKNEILDIINNQPIVNKKKKKLKRFSLDE